MKSLKLIALFLTLVGGSQAFADHSFYYAKSQFNSSLDYKARVMQSNARTLLYTLNYHRAYYGVKHDLRQLIAKTQNFRRVMWTRFNYRAKVRTLALVKQEFAEIQRKMSRIRFYRGHRYGYRHHNLWKIKNQYNRLSNSFYSFQATANRVVYNRYYRKFRYSYR